jgi:hypothetical protein
LVGGGDQCLPEVAPRECGQVLAEHAPEVVEAPVADAAQRGGVAAVVWLSIPSWSPGTERGRAAFGGFIHARKLQLNNDAPCDRRGKSVARSCNRGLLLKRAGRRL